MKNNFTISQRNAIVENHLWCIKAVMKQNRALIRAAKLDTDDAPPAALSFLSQEKR